MARAWPRKGSCSIPAKGRQSTKGRIPPGDPRSLLEFQLHQSARLLFVSEAGVKEPFLGRRLRTGLSMPPGKQPCNGHHSGSQNPQPLVLSRGHGTGDSLPFVDVRSSGRQSENAPCSFLTLSARSGDPLMAANSWNEFNISAFDIATSCSACLTGNPLSVLRSG